MSATPVHGIVDNWKKSCVTVKVFGVDSLERKIRGRPASVAENGHSTLSGSGFILDSDNGIICTTGDIIIPFLLRDETSQRPKDNRTLLPGTVVSIAFDQTGHPSEFDWNECELLGVFTSHRSGGCVRSLATDFAHRVGVGWGKDIDTVSHYADGMTTYSVMEDNSQATYMYSSDGNSVEHVSLLRTKMKSYAFQNIFKSVILGNSDSLQKGCPLVTISSPFGCISPTIFQNSVATGVVSLAVQDSLGNSLIFTDARCLPGSEGGAVFDSINGGKLIGVIAPPLKFVSGYPIALNIIIPINTILPILEKFTNNVFLPPPETDLLVVSPVKEASKSLVYLKIGSLWASGIIVSNKGHILTNAHLFNSSVPELAKKHLPTVVDLEISPEKYTELVVIVQIGSYNLLAKPLYISHTHLDVALLQIQENPLFRELQPIKFSPFVNIKHGLPVWVLAHAFDSTKGITGICSTGIISNIVYIDGEPVSIQTTAPVHSGNSGGLLVNSNGELVGMVTSNTRQRDGVGSIIHRLNFSIPAPSLAPLVQYSNGDDLMALKRLKATKMDTTLMNLWRLQNSPREVKREVGQSFFAYVEKMQQEIPLANSNGPRLQSNL